MESIIINVQKYTTDTDLKSFLALNKEHPTAENMRMHIGSVQYIVLYEGMKPSMKEVVDFVRKNPGKPIPLVFVRNGREYATTVTPITSTVKNLFGEDIQETVIGVTPSGKFFTKELGFFEAFENGMGQTWGIIKMTALSLLKLVQRKLPLETLGGPIFIAQLAGQQAQEGWINLLFFTALLSVNLGILNLLPIPVLDGGHLFFFGFEWLRGKPLSLKKREMAQQVGMFILILLMVFVFYNDIARIIGGQ